MAISKSEKTAGLIAGVFVLIVVAWFAVQYLGGSSSTAAITTTSTSGPSSGTQTK